MTADKDFKRIVRARARKTGESYAAARRRLSSREDTHHMKFHAAVPILRIFDVEKAKAFYVDYLGMSIDFEHRFEPGLPLYMQVSRGDLVLHLSEHHGDGTPGSAVYLDVDRVQDLHAELAAKEYPNLRPSLETDEIGTWIKLTDPFGNLLRFNERPARP